MFVVGDIPLMDLARSASLRSGWDELMAKLKVSPADTAPVFDLLVAAYSAPDRHYHTLEHIKEYGTLKAMGAKTAGVGSTLPAGSIAWTAP